MNKTQLIEGIENILNDPFGGRGLTWREKQAANLVARGFSQSEIAEKLGVSKDAVKGRVKVVLRKLELTKSRELTELLLEQIEALIAR